MEYSMGAKWNKSVSEKWLQKNRDLTLKCHTTRAVPLDNTNYTSVSSNILKNWNFKTRDFTVNEIVFGTSLG